MKVKQLDYHRNGVEGLEFYVGIVQDENREMLVIRFPKEADKETGSVVCAAFDLALLDKREIKFLNNSWRGDHYHEIMDKAIQEREV
jgi:predicted 3-demethylubiquinone-9 3-methyltransferase (glyoxalase superfamily)